MSIQRASTPKPKLQNIIKAVQMVYEFPGKLVAGWEAEHMGGDDYRIHRHDGSHRDVTIDGVIRTLSGPQRVSLDDSGCLIVGDGNNVLSVIIGRNIEHGMHARKLGKPNTFLVFKGGTSDGTAIKNLGEFKLGESVTSDSKGPALSQSSPHLLNFDGKSIPIVPQKRSIELLVLDKPSGTGYLSYINVKVRGDSDNGRNAPMGVFTPASKAGEPATFTEDSSGVMLTTALFWVNSNKRSIKCNARSREDALKEIQAEKAMAAAEDIAVSAGIEPEDYHAYVEAKSAFTAAANKWQEINMHASKGIDRFYEIGRTRTDSSPSPGAS